MGKLVLYNFEGALTTVPISGVITSQIYRTFFYTSVIKRVLEQHTKQGDHVVIYSDYTSRTNIQTLLMRAGIDTSKVVILGEDGSACNRRNTKIGYLKVDYMQKMQELKLEAVVIVDCNRNIVTNAENIFHIMVPSIYFGDQPLSHAYLDCALLSAEKLRQQCIKPNVELAKNMENSEITNKFLDEFYVNAARSFSGVTKSQRCYYSDIDIHKYFACKKLGLPEDMLSNMDAIQVLQAYVCSSHFNFLHHRDEVKVFIAAQTRDVELQADGGIVSNLLRNIRGSLNPTGTLALTLRYLETRNHNSKNVSSLSQSSLLALCKKLNLDIKKHETPAHVAKLIFDRYISPPLFSNLHHKELIRNINLTSLHSAQDYYNAIFEQISTNIDKINPQGTLALMFMVLKDLSVQEHNLELSHLCTEPSVFGIANR